MAIRTLVPIASVLIDPERGYAVFLCVVSTFAVAIMYEYKDSPEPGTRALGTGLVRESNVYAEIDQLTSILAQGYSLSVYVL